ncbi:MAG: PhoH family protein [Spirochaetales bacterium]|nr:PhoH family protein [Spirochaetales bacterium]
MKTFVIDTNVLIHKPDAILSFRDNEVVIPLWVLEELDRLKTFSDERGRSARQAVRFLDEHCKNADVRIGVKIENGSTLRILGINEDFFVPGLDHAKADNKIIGTAVSLAKEGKTVFFVSKDINARVKAQALGIKAVDYEKQKVNINELYSGCRDVSAAAETMEKLNRDEYIEWTDRLHPNEYVTLHDSKSDEFMVARYNHERSTLDLVEKPFSPVAGIKPLNIRQTMAFNALLNDTVSLVTMVGVAGTGKTLLAIAAGLRKVLEDKKYTRVLVSRPVVPMGKDIGYLPGAKNEKLSHWMQPLFDNLDYILSVYKKQQIKSVDSLLNNKLIEIEALTYIRGRSLPNQYIIIDEAQNLSPHEVKTIVSRAGEGSKLILTGDPYQIDNPYLDASSNGLTYLVEAFKDQDICAHITLDKTERSRLAELAAEIL